MATGESITWAGLTTAEAVKLAENAFLIASWLARPREIDGEWCDGEAPSQFCESVAQTFEALLADHAEQFGHGFLTSGYGQGVAAVLKEIPRGWRPAYAVTPGRSLGGRSEAKGGGEAPLQSGARID